MKSLVTSALLITVALFVSCGGGNNGETEYQVDPELSASNYASLDASQKAALRDIGAYDLNSYYESAIVVSTKSIRTTSKSLLAKSLSATKSQDINEASTETFEGLDGRGTAQLDISVTGNVSDTELKATINTITKLSNYVRYDRCEQEITISGTITCTYDLTIDSSMWQTLTGGCDTNEPITLTGNDQNTHSNSFSHSSVASGNYYADKPENYSIKGTFTIDDKIVNLSDLTSAPTCEDASSKTLQVKDVLCKILL